ncbi:MAG TPA: hypothetical protein VF144_01220 [Chitinophagaceae bacterium]
MERQFNNGDFEKLLRDNANQYRMYPSEKVWKGIHSALHTRRKWYGLTAAIMFLLTGSVVSIVIYSDKPGANNQIEQQNNPSQNNNQPREIASTSNNTKTFTPAINKNNRVSRPTANLAELYVAVPGFNNTPANDDKEPDLNRDANLINMTQQYIPDPAIANKNEILDQLSFDTYFGLLKQNNLVTKEEDALGDILTDQKNITEQSSVDDATEKDINAAISAIASQNVLLPIPAKQARVTAQVYFTPTVSYRKLDVRDVVKHKPAMGLEFGIEGRYKASDKFFVKTGLQFNINRYDIRAYPHPTEIATVALSNGFGGVDSSYQYSDYRNISNTNPNWLENFYFQIAVPVGAEVIISDNKNIQWGISGTIQPTYVIGDKAYLISSDYKNYAEFPDLIRRWNISTGVGTFVSYSTGRIRWQVGPHLRYQHLSSFVSALPVKEKLYSVGLKIGATFNK